MWAPVEFIHIENCRISSDIVKKIENEIINSFKDGYTNSSTLFSKDEIYYLENNIPNATALFSVIDKFLGNNFYCKRPHILENIPVNGQFKTEDVFERVIKKNYIYKSENERVSKLEILENYIYEKGIVSLNEMIEKLGWQEYTILQTLTLSKVVLS